MFYARKRVTELLDALGFDALREAVARGAAHTRHRHEDAAALAVRWF
jgi:hypothetical protein